MIPCAISLCYLMGLVSGLLLLSFDKNYIILFLFYDDDNDDDDVKIYIVSLSPPFVLAYMFAAL